MISHSDEILNLLVKDERLENELRRRLKEIKRLDHKKLDGLLKNIEWKKIYKSFESEYENLYVQFDLSKIQEGLFANKIYFKRKILVEIIDKIILTIMIEDKIKSVKGLNENLIGMVKQYFKVFQLQHLIENMDKDKLKKMIESDKLKLKELEKFRGKNHKKENLELYGKIFQKNDEYIERDDEGNYRKAARIVFKNWPKWESKYGSFNKFKNSYKIYTFDEFKKFLSTIRE